MVPNIKYCSCCNEFKDLMDFHNNRSSRDGKAHYCKKCQIIKTTAYKKLNKDKVAKHSRTTYLNHLENRREWARNYKKTHRKAIAEYRKNKRTENLEILLSDTIRNLINQSIDKDRFYGSSRYLEYSMMDLKKHLESLFKPGMNWENKGKNGWHIDHIIPLKYKNPDGTYYWNQEELSDPNSETFKKAWSLDNLQPLWKEENIQKGNRWIG